jgi:hypothetical protein
MSTAEYAYRVLVDANFVAYDNQPLDAFTTRLVLSNLNHLSDMNAQVCATLSTSVAGLSGKLGYLTPGTPAAVDTPYAIVSATFPICIRERGQSYRMRIRIGGATANATATATFRAVLSSASTAPAAVSDASDAVFLTAGTTSTTAAWLTGASQGSGAYTTMIEMNPTQVAGAIVSRPTTDLLAGVPTSVDIALVTLSVFGLTTNVTHSPRLSGLYAAEVIGT